MPLRKPALGYPSRTDAILALGSRGLGDAEIAERIGMTLSSVRSARSTGRRAAIRCGQTTPDGRAVALPIETLRDLRPHAERRGLHVTALVRQLLDLVIADGLVDAVLDDGVSA